MSNPRVRYFVLDENARLHQASQTVVEGIWRGKRRIAELKIPVGDALRIVTVVCDAKLVPIARYFLCLNVRDGAVEADTRLAAVRATLEFAEACQKVRRKPARRNRSSESFELHLQGWPQDIHQQLAIVLDFSPADLAKCGIGVGGPLPAATGMDMSIREYLRYYDQT